MARQLRTHCTDRLSATIFVFSTCPGIGYCSPKGMKKMLAPCWNFTCCTVMAVLHIVLAILCIVGAEVAMPMMMKGAMQDLAVMDTEAKFAKTLGVENTLETTVTFLNLTNAYDLQTVTPRPNPIFVEVPVVLTVKTQSFDYELSADESYYKYKTWSYVTTKTPSEANLVITQLNGYLSAVLMGFGGEAALAATHTAVATAAYAAGLSLTDPATWSPSSVAGLCASIDPTPAAVPMCIGAALTYAALLGEAAMPMRPDGTKMTNYGLFTRRTIDEILNGHFDPLLQMQTPGSTAGYNIFPNITSLQAALASGVEPAAKWTSAKKTGKGNIADVGKWHLFRGQTNVSTAAMLDLTLPAWAPRTIGYDSTGDMTTVGRGPFVIDGLRSSSNPIPAVETPPSVLLTGFPPKAQPTANRFTYFDDVSLFREVSYSCPNGACTHESLHDSVEIVKYQMESNNGWLKQGGALDPTGACAMTMSCDYGMMADAAWPIFPGTMTLPYFGNSSAALISSSTFKNAAGDTMTYDDATHRNEIYLEPFSGLPLKIKTSYMFNTNTNAALFTGGTLYANVFSAPVPMYWPNSIAPTDFELTAAQAGELGTALRMGYLSMIGLLCTGAWYLILTFYFSHKAYSLRKQSKATKPTNEKGINEKGEKEEIRTTDPRGSSPIPIDA